MSDRDISAEEYMRRFGSFLASHAAVEQTAIDGLRLTTTRAELGITSPQIILVMVEYGNAASPEIVFKPEWVSRLEDLRGIVSVMRELDALALQPVGVP